MSKSSSMFLQDLQLAYAEVLERIFNCYTHDDDGGCNHEATAQKGVFTINDVMVIYQPIGDELWWVENSCILMMPSKESGIKLTKAIFNKATPLFREVEKKLIDSVNGFITKYGGWIEPLGRVSEETCEPKLTFNKITGIFAPIDFDEKSGKLKMKWELKTLYETLSRWWNPVELMNWKYTLPAYKRYRFSKYTNIISIIKSKMEENIEILNKNRTRIIALKESTQEYKDTLENIKNKSELIEYQESEIERYTNILNKDHDPEEKYIDCDDEYIAEWYKRPGHNRSTLVTYEDAFGVSESKTSRQTESISGKKRVLFEPDPCVVEIKKSKK